jgi:hypothetical protein
MIDHITTFALCVQKTKNEVLFYPVLGMKMDGYPEPALKMVTVYKDGVEQEMTFDSKKMWVTENINDSIIKVRVANSTKGKVEVKTNRPMNNVEVLGLMELGKIQYVKTLVDDVNRQQIIQN